MPCEMRTDTPIQSHCGLNLTQSESEN
ncbi:hypothetical protein BCEN4_350114 [Burkholderia cenocepacia]|nr:hypothetical protein BCEN4_350114 [Burkholderia cenocepacia]